MERGLAPPNEMGDGALLGMMMGSVPLLADDPWLPELPIPREPQPEAIEATGLCLAGAPQEAVRAGPTAENDPVDVLSLRMLSPVYRACDSDPPPACSTSLDDQGLLGSLVTSRKAAFRKWRREHPKRPLADWVTLKAKREVRDQIRRNGLPLCEDCWREPQAESVRCAAHLYKRRRHEADEAQLPLASLPRSAEAVTDATPLSNKRKSTGRSAAPSVRIDLAPKMAAVAGSADELAAHAVRALSQRLVWQPQATAT